MVFKEFYNFMLKRKRRTERIHTVKKFTIGIGVVGTVIATLLTANHSRKRYTNHNKPGEYFNNITGNFNCHPKSNLLL